MKLIMVGSDRKMFDSNSAVHIRHKGYAMNLQSLCVLIPVTDATQSGVHEYDDRFSVYGVYSPVRIFAYLRLIFVLWWTTKSLLPQRYRVVAQDPFEFGFIVYLVSKIVGFDYVVQFHTDPYSVAFQKHSLLNRLRMLFLPIVVRSAVRIRVVGKRIFDSIAGQFLSLVPRLIVLPIASLPSISRDVLVPTTYRSGDTFRILTVCRLEPEKGVDFMLRVFAQFHGQIVNSEFIIVGDGSLREMLEHLAESLQIASVVRFVGWVEDPVPYYQQAHCYLCASEYEGYGMSLIEAGMYAVPIVSTPVGVIGYETPLSKVVIAYPQRNIKMCIDGLLLIESSYSALDADRFAMQEESVGLVINSDEYSRRWVRCMTE